MNNKQGNLYIVSAASGTGKTSLLNKLIKDLDDIKMSVSYTTRAPRSNEKDGEDYFFVNQENFDQLVSLGAFLEYAHVFDQSYATRKSAVAKDLNAGKDVILEIDFQGAQQVRKKMPEAIGIFILPPSREALRQRIIGRNQDHSDMIQKRLAKAAEEISHHEEYDYLLVNDDFDDALKALKAIVRSNRYRQSVQSESLKVLLEELMHD